MGVYSLSALEEASDAKVFEPSTTVDGERVIV